MKRISTISFALLLASTLAVAQNLLHGDLLFVLKSGSGAFGEAISASTNKLSEAPVVHVAIVVKDDDKVNVLEASDEHGVWQCPLDTFLSHVPHDSDGTPLVLVGRLNDRTSVNQSVERAKTYIGRPYDFLFSPTEDEIYCSELVQLAFRDEKGNPIFSRRPMSFHDSSGNILPYWVEYYKKRGLPVPEGEPGTNPGDLSRSDKLTIHHYCIDEARMRSDLLQMLADFSQYMVADFQPCESPNSEGEVCGYFRGEDNAANNEKGVRPNADLSMVAAFLVKYAKPARVTLPEGVTWKKLEDIAMQSLVFAYSTHKANRLKACSRNNYWGSTSVKDKVWESSLWAMSVAYSAFFQWDKLSNKQRSYIYSLLKAECDYELNRTIPTAYKGDTKAEENGWEADVLAATLGLFPNDSLAPRWFERMREFAVNSYSHPKDAEDTTVIDPWYDRKTVADLYRGQNLYQDFSLQNHNLFHTSYQNVVMQELGEAALALKIFQRELYGEEQWYSNSLMHNNQEVQDSILNWLALADGELAMPNGNDWSLFLYDQITSYSTQACFQRDSNALLLEYLAYRQIKARQSTTKDGSWLLRPDVGARRMGVQAHRVMMTFLMHEMMPTHDLLPVTWMDFNREFSEARLLPCQNIVRASSDWRFTCFSWSEGLKSYTGYFAANSEKGNKIVVPYRANNTGNLLGWYEVKGRKTNARPILSGAYEMKGNAYVMNGEINTNDSALNNRFALYSTQGNALIYLDYVSANEDCVIKAEKGGMLALSTDELTSLTRTLYYDKYGTTEHATADGKSLVSFKGDWVNIDDELGVVSVGNGKAIAFGDRRENNSVFTSKLYPLYSDKQREVTSGELVDARNLVYYSLQETDATRAMAERMVSLRDRLTEGWNGVLVPDETGWYILVSNFKGTSESALHGVSIDGWAPVLREPTIIKDNASSVLLKAKQNSSIGYLLPLFVKGTNVSAQLLDNRSASITAMAKTKVIVRWGDGEPQIVKLKKGESRVLRLTP